MTRCLNVLHCSRCLGKVHHEVIHDKEQDLPAGLSLSPKRTLHRDKLTGRGGRLTLEKSVA